MHGEEVSDDNGCRQCKDCDGVHLILAGIAAGHFISLSFAFCCVRWWLPLLAELGIATLVCGAWFCISTWGERMSRENNLLLRLARGPIEVRIDDFAAIKRMERKKTVVIDRHKGTGALTAILVEDWPRWDKEG
jgi:hypothetical protein